MGSNCRPWGLGHWLRRRLLPSSARKALFFAAVLVAAVPIHAQEFSYQSRLKLYESVQPMGDAPFGEQISLYTGTLSFNHIDVTLEGTGPTIVLGRYVDTKVRYWPSIGTLGDWDLTIPRIETLVRSPYPTGGGIPGENWKTEDPDASTLTGTLQRCTKFNIPYDSAWMHSLWWNGYEFINERGQRQPLLKRSSTYTAVPQIAIDGQAVKFTGVSPDNWQIGCLPGTTNGQVGEGFLMVSPDGTRYHMTHLVGIPAGSINETWCDDSGGSTTAVATEGYTDQRSHRYAYEEGPRLQNDGGPGYIAPFPTPEQNETSTTTAMALPGNCYTIRYGRMFVSMYVTKIEDRFGNYVSYNYSGNKLTSIIGSDGRNVTINWRTDWRAIDTIVINGTQSRTWTYAYAGDYSLHKVTLPDQSYWEFNSLPVTVATSAEYQGLCTFRQRDPATLQSLSSVGTIKTPSNLLGTFDVRTTWFGRSYVPSRCVKDATFSEYYEQIPPLFHSGALHSRTMSGPGIPIRTWTYSYSPALGSTTEDACAASNSCHETSWVDVTEPDNTWTRYTFSTRWGVMEGKQQKVETFDASDKLLRTTTSQYLATSQGAYPSTVGGSFAHWQTNAGPTERWAPVVTQQILQNGRRFIWQVATGCTHGYCFDWFARPTRTVKSSTPAP